MNQKVYGILILILCICVVIMAAQGTTMEERDITVVIFLLPLGLYAIFGKQRILYDSNGTTLGNEEPPARIAASTGGRDK